MDWSPLITVASSLAGLGVGALAGWFGVQGKILQLNAQKKFDKAQADAEIEAAQNAVIVRQKIGQIAAGAIEDTNRYDPPEVKKKLAMELAQQLAGEASTPSTDAQLLPNIQAGVAALPATRTGLPPNSTTTTTTVVSSQPVPSVPSGTTIDETVAKG
jgi:hypothetical protein